MKSEPSEYSIDDLARDGQSSWFGVRNYQARNFMREMQLGDMILFYHSSCDKVWVAGLAEVVSLPHADESQFDPKGKYYDPKATRDTYLWDCVDVKFVKKFNEVISLADIRQNPSLTNMRILQKWNRLSITPVSEKEYETIVNMGK